jgi:hypothetical protein
MEIRPHVGAPPAARLADETMLYVGELRDLLTVCKVICATQTKVYHSFYFERPQARRTHRAREAAELLEQARRADFWALRAAAVAVWIVKVAISKTPRTVIFCGRSITVTNPPLPRASLLIVAD